MEYCGIKTDHTPKVIHDKPHALVIKNFAKEVKVEQLDNMHCPQSLPLTLTPNPTPNSRPSTELNRVLNSPWASGVSHEVINRNTQRQDPNRIWINLFDEQNLIEVTNPIYLEKKGLHGYKGLQSCTEKRTTVQQPLSVTQHAVHWILLIVVQSQWELHALFSIRSQYKGP